MNKIYLVQWANYDTVSCINIVVQGEELTESKAKTLAKEEILNICGLRYFKKYMKLLKQNNITNITNRNILNVVFTNVDI